MGCGGLRAPAAEGGAVGPRASAARVSAGRVGILTGCWVPVGRGMQAAWPFWSRVRVSGKMPVKTPASACRFGGAAGAADRAHPLYLAIYVDGTGPACARHPFSHALAGEMTSTFQKARIRRPFDRARCPKHALGVRLTVPAALARRLPRPHRAPQQKAPDPSRRRSRGLSLQGCRHPCGAQGLVGRARSSRPGVPGRLCAYGYAVTAAAALVPARRPKVSAVPSEMPATMTG